MESEWGFYFCHTLFNLSVCPYPIANKSNRVRVSVSLLQDGIQNKAPTG